MGIEGFGSRLRTVRTDRALTQKQLAASLGVTEQAVSKWERETSYPDIVILNSISNVLDCSLDYLFQYEPGKRSKVDQDSVENREEINRNLLPDIISLKIGEALIPLFEGESKNGFPHVKQIRKQIASQWGILIPAMRIVDQEGVEASHYQICLNGKIVFQEELREMNEDGLVRIFGNLKGQILKNISSVLNNQSIYLMVENLRKQYPYVVEGVVPEKITYSLLRQVVMHMIVDYGYTVGPLILIIESIERNIMIDSSRELAKAVISDLGEAFKMNDK